MNKVFTLLFCVLVIVFYNVTIFAQKNAVTELPMQFRGLMPAVEVTVNGKGPFIFAIDTGAQGTLRVDSTLVEKLSLKKNGEMQAGDGSGQNTRTLDTVGVDSIKVGDLEFKNLTALTRNYNTTPNISHIDGILGFGLFKEYLLTLDYPDKRVRIEKGELGAANGKDIISFEQPRGTPEIELRLGEQKIRARIDSGNMVGGFILPTAIVEKSPLIGETKVVGRARTVSNDIEIKQARLKDSLYFGNFDFAQPAVTFPALGPEANIGSLILREFSLTFDQKNNRVKLQRTKLAEEVKTQIAAAPAKFEPKEFVGKYGERTITAEGGDLFIQRPNAPKFKMAPLSKDEFTLEQIPAARFKFTRDEKGVVTGVQVRTQTGEWETAKKDS